VPRPSSLLLTCVSCRISKQLCKSCAIFLCYALDLERAKHGQAASAGHESLAELVDDTALREEDEMLAHMPKRGVRHRREVTAGQLAEGSSTRQIEINRI